MTDNRRPENEPQGKGKNKLTRKEAEKGVKADTLKKKKRRQGRTTKANRKRPKGNGGREEVGSREQASGTKKGEEKGGGVGGCFLGTG